MTVRIRRIAVPGSPDCTHDRRTGEFTDDDYRQSCDECDAETTDLVEGGAAEAFILNLDGPDDGPRIR